MGKVIVAQLLKLLEKNPDLVGQLLEALVQWAVAAMQDAVEKIKAEQAAKKQ